MSENNWIAREVLDLANERGTTTSRAFAAWCLRFAHEIDDDEALVNTDTLSGEPGGDGGLDGWWKDEPNRDFHLWQCKWSEDGIVKYSRQPAVELSDAAQALLDVDAASERGAVFQEVSAKLRTAIDSEYDLVLNIGLHGQMTNSARKQIRKSLRQLQESTGVNIRWEIWDIAAFQSTSEDRHPTNDTLSGIQVPIILQSTNILEIADIDPTLPSPWEAVVASLNAGSLGDAAAAHGVRLFSLNVRYALGSNRRIKSLHRSLVDPGDNRYFWLYNNGITIICDDFSLLLDESPPKVIIENPQVVNGCQTVTAFRRRRGEYDGAPSVLARIIKPPSGEEGKDHALLIAERTNSQNEVRSRDLKSNNRVQKKLAVAFDQLDKPWFYERKRGQWSSLPSREKSIYRQIPGQSSIQVSSRKIDMEKAGQSFRILFRPSSAITKKKELFDDDDVYTWVFQDHRSPEHYLFAYLLRLRLEKLWHHQQIDYLQSIVGQHAQPAIVRRMLRAKGQIVAHSMALTRMLLQKEDPTPGQIEYPKWTLDDARNGLRFAERFDPVGHQWTRLLWKGFHELLGRTDISDDDDPKSFKKMLERPNEKSAEELWTSVAEAASFLVGPNWRTSLRDSILGQITD